MYLTKTPDFLKPIASDLVWDIRSGRKEVFLTFDDGPNPDVTPILLRVLADYNAKATFFCVGSNAKRHPKLLKSILQNGHAIGNHTYDHESGWETSLFSYLKSYVRCQKLTKTNLFRPPYGRIKREQVRALKDHTNIIMWDVLSGDFDPKRTPQMCTNTVLKHSSPGSIIVFHDSVKAKDNVLGSLPLVLEELTRQGYSFPVIAL